MSGAAAFGTTLYIGGTAGTALANVTRVQWSGLQSDQIDVSAMDGASAFREYVAGMIEPGEVTLDLNFDPGATSHAAMKTALEGRGTAQYAIKWSDAANTVYNFTAFVRSMSGGGQYDDKLEGSVTLKITGPIT